MEDSLVQTMKFIEWNFSKRILFSEIVRTVTFKKKMRKEKGRQTNGRSHSEIEFIPKLNSFGSECFLFIC